MGLLLVGIIASAAISEALARQLFDGEKVPTVPQNAAEGQLDGTEKQGDSGDNRTDFEV